MRIPHWLKHRWGSWRRENVKVNYTSGLTTRTTVQVRECVVCNKQQIIHFGSV